MPGDAPHMSLLSPPRSAEQRHHDEVNQTFNRSIDQSSNHLNQSSTDKSINPLIQQSTGSHRAQSRRHSHDSTSYQSTNQSSIEDTVTPAHTTSQSNNRPINPWPCLPLSPNHRQTHLKALPLTHRILPKFIRNHQIDHSNNESIKQRWRIPVSILKGLAPVPLFDHSNNQTINQAINQTIFEHGETAHHDQSIIERIQLERMKQSSEAAINQSNELATGESDLLKTNQFVNRTINQKRPRSMSLPNTMPTLTIQQAALASALHKQSIHNSTKLSTRTLNKRVQFHALLDPLPIGATQIFNQSISRSRRHRSYSHADSYSATHQPNDQSFQRHSHHVAPSRNLFGLLVDCLIDCFRETVFLIHLGILLVAQMGLFGVWVWMTVRLIIFALFLIPAWCKIGYATLFCHRIERSIQYGPYNRNFLDIYLPTAARGSVLQPVLNSRQYEREQEQELNNQSANQSNSDQSSTVPENDWRRRSKHPVLVYVTGGAWIIGYKAWGALIGLLLRAQGFMVVSVDYRNFPQGNIEDMVVDVEQALRWVYDNIDDFGGDRERIYLSGQSAGGHITSILLCRNAKRESEGVFQDELSNNQSSNQDEKLAQAQAIVAEASEIVRLAEMKCVTDDDTMTNDKQSIKSPRKHFIKLPNISPIHERNESSSGSDSESVDDQSVEQSYSHSTADQPDDSPSASPTSLIALSSALRTGFPVSRLKGYIGVSGVFSMSAAVLDHLHSCGLPGGTTLQIMGGLAHLPAVDPTRLFHQPEYSHSSVTSLLPPMFLIAGSRDKSAPLAIPHEFAVAAAKAGVPVTFRCYANATHTDPIIEHPMQGCHHLTHDIKMFVEQCENGEAECGRIKQSFDQSTSRGGQSEGHPLKINRLPSLMFEVNGEVMVSHILVRCAQFFNPF